MEYEKVLRSINHNEHYLKRYLKFLSSASKKKRNGELHKHHVCPVGDFPEFKDFKKFKWNMIHLTPREHFIAHLLLWKTYRTFSCTFAFNMMRNLFNDGDLTNSKLYDVAMQDFKKALDSREFKPKTEDQLKQISDRFKGKVLVSFNMIEPMWFYVSRDEYDKNKHFYFTSMSGKNTN